MPTLTTNYSFNKPLVNNPIDEDLWGGQLNSNWDSVDSILNQIVPIGLVVSYAGTTAPNSRWLLCDGAAVSRTTYATLFALVSTSFGIGDGSTTFNLPDLRGRAVFGLDNLGGSSANRITDANADSLNNTGFGDEDITASASGTTDGHTLTISEMPSHTHGMFDTGGGTRGRLFDQTGSVAVPGSVAMDATGGGGSHSHGITSVSVTGSSGANLSPGIALGAIIKALV